jgi:hypothetical protein
MYELRPADADRLLSPNTYDDGAWHFVKGVYDGTTEYLYVDGNLVGQQDVSPPVANSADIRVGGFFEGRHDGAFIGCIDEVRVYNTPEPGSLGMLALGGLAFLRRRYGRASR